MKRAIDKLSAPVLIAFACVYFFWGSTFVAIRFGVQALPPFVIASARPLIAGPLLLAICAMRGLKLWQSRREFAMLAVLGVLMLGIGNTGLVWSEQYLSSGLASLLVAVIPLYVALLEAVLPRGEGLRTRGWLGICVGFIGLIVLLWPGLREGMHGQSGQLKGSLVAVTGAFGWAVGSVLSRRAKLKTPVLVAAGWQITFAGVFNFLLMKLAGEDYHVHFDKQAVLAIAWLVVFGSIVGFSAYVYLLEHVPVAKVATYAYINPIVAVVLGALLLGERLVPIEYVGMAAVLIAVYLVTSSKLKGAKMGDAEVADLERLENVS